jgi:hypothetical protein
MTFNHRIAANSHGRPETAPPRIDAAPGLIDQTKMAALTTISKATPKQTVGCKTQIRTLPIITIRKTKFGA